MKLQDLLHKINHWYKKDKKIIITSLAIGFIFTIGFTGYTTKAYSETIHSGLEQELIRFHVIANSDLEEDQILKLKVRDAILSEMKPILDNQKNVEQSRQIILDNTDKIKTIAEKIIQENNKSYSVNVRLESAMFPTKKYGDIVLPAGKYEALRVIIGDGEGKNWWCVMFPPLCFVDITHGTVSDKTKQEFKSVLTEEEYKLIVSTENESIVPIKIKFKLVEWWQENKQIETIFAHIKDQ